LINEGSRRRHNLRDSLATIRSLTELAAKISVGAGSLPTSSEAQPDASKAAAPRSHSTAPTPSTECSAVWATRRSTISTLPPAPAATTSAASPAPSAPSPSCGSPTALTNAGRVDAPTTRPDEVRSCLLSRCRPRARGGRSRARAGPAPGSDRLGTKTRPDRCTRTTALERTLRHPRSGWLPSFDANCYRLARRVL
jgi:hypothetical protein